MVVVLLTTVYVGILIYRRIRKRRAIKRAMKLAAVDRAVSRAVAVDATEESFSEDEVIIIERETSLLSSPPRYSTLSPHPYEPSEDPAHLAVPGFEYSRTYRDVRDKPPPYSAAVLQVQNL